MRKNPFEHGFVTQASALPEGWEHLSSDEITKILGGKLHDIVVGLDSGLAGLDGGGWEVVSHNTMAVEKVLVINFLIRREKAVDPGCRRDAVGSLHDVEQKK